jgi:hypothetical protein
MRPTVLLLLHVFVAMGMCLPSCCLTMKGGLHFTKPLPSDDRMDTHTDTLIDGRCHDISTKFHKDWFMHSKVNSRDSQAHRQHGDHISLL